MARQTFTHLIFLVFCLLCGQLRADLILNNIGSVEWDRTQLPNGSAPVYFSVSSNAVDPSLNELNAFSVGVRIVPTSGASGSIEIKSVAIPDANQIFNTYASNLPLVKQGDIQTISGENGPFANVTIPASGRNLFMAQFYSPGNNAIGKFDIYLDRDTTNYFTTTAFDGFKFFNVPALGDPQGVFIGSITTSITAVPEPSALLLSGLGASAVALRRLRRLR